MLTALIQSVTDADISGVKVGVTLEDLGPVVDRTVILTLVLVVKCVNQDVVYSVLWYTVKDFAVLSSRSMESPW